MCAIRIVFSKQGRIQYTSHLDIVRTFLRIFHRAEIPVSLTQGFNPHPYMVFSAPLSLGVCSRCEMLDVKTSVEMSADEIFRRLQKAVPDGIGILEVYPDGRPFRDIRRARYLLSVENVYAEQFRAFFEQSVITREKKAKKGGTKTVDLKSALRLCGFSETPGYITADITLPCGSEENVGVTLYTDAFSDFIHKNDYLRRIERICFFDGQDEIFR